MNILQFIYDNNFKSFLDIGANNGDTSNTVRRHFPHINLYAIEANPNCEHDLISKNIPHMICCLSNEEKNINFYISKLGDGKNTGASYYKENSYHYSEGNYDCIQLKTKTLDSIFDKNVSFDFIKLDTQGSEIDIIKGGLELIKKAKYVVLELAILEYNQGAPFKDEVFYFMKNINYVPYVKCEEHKYQDGTVFQEDWIFKNTKV